MKAQLFLEAQGVVARERLAIPLELPWLKLLGSFELTAIVGFELCFGVVCNSRKTAVHTIFK